MEPVMSSAADQLLQAGLLGVFVLVFGAVIYLLYREQKAEREALFKKIEELQQARVADAASQRDLFVEVIKQCTQAMSSMTVQLENSIDTMSELKQAFRDMAEELRNRGTRRG